MSGTGPVIRQGWRETLTLVLKFWPITLAFLAYGVHHEIEHSHFRTFMEAGARMTPEMYLEAETEQERRLEIKYMERQLLEEKLDRLGEKLDDIRARLP